jgi:hydroxyacylglutathione hydrolase
MRSFVTVAPGLEWLALGPLRNVNVYRLGDVLVDAGGRFASRQLLRALEGRPLRAHALTHAHFDHQGGSHAVCARFDVPLWCGAGDREALETGDLARLLPRPDSWIGRLENRLGGPPHPVARVLREGDDVGEFTVLEAPGHTPGTVVFWREADRALVLGDVAFHLHPATLKRGLQEPITGGTRDPTANRAALRRLAALDPACVCFGHGEPLRDPAAFRAFVAGLPTP